MSSESEQDPLPSTRYPPTTALWVTSPLIGQEDLQRNPLEPTPPKVTPRARLGALLIIGSGLLALVALYTKFSLLTTGLGLWYHLLLATVTIIPGMAFALGGLVFQVLDVVILLVSLAGGSSRLLASHQ